jgi:hypothetical protein
MQMLVLVLPKASTVSSIESKDFESVFALVVRFVPFAPLTPFVIVSSL